MAGLLFVFSGPSGVGKSTIRKRLCEDPRIVRSVSCTTRPPREGEVDGVDYFFSTESDFVARIARNDFLEHAHVFGRHYYGTPRQWVEEQIAAGKVVLLEIEVQGARKTARAGLPRFSLFVRPPNWDVLEQRLRDRNSDSPESIDARLATARDEIAAAGEFDAQVVNDDLDACVAQILRLIDERLQRGDN
ncbi:MAG: guanylate kinase [Planctomycetota bacterium]|jgi:guanylate kinase